VGALDIIMYSIGICAQARFIPVFDMGSLAQCFGAPDLRDLLSIAEMTEMGGVGSWENIAMLFLLRPTATIGVWEEGLVLRRCSSCAESKLKLTPCLIFLYFSSLFFSFLLAVKPALAMVLLQRHISARRWS